jgi:hypothetical protein
MECEVVSEADARRALLPSSPAMTIAGVVSHLRWVEHGWFKVSCLGKPDCGPSTNDDPPRGMASRAFHSHLGHLDALRELADGVTGY